MQNFFTDGDELQNEKLNIADSTFIAVCIVSLFLGPFSLDFSAPLSDTIS